MAEKKAKKTIYSRKKHKQITKHVHLPWSSARNSEHASLNNLFSVTRDHKGWQKKTRKTQVIAEKTSTIQSTIQSRRKRHAIHSRTIHNKKHKSIKAQFIAETKSTIHSRNKKKKQVNSRLCPCFCPFCCFCKAAGFKACFFCQPWPSTAPAPALPEPQPVLFCHRRCGGQHPKP